MSKPTPRSPITLEQLLRLKRAEKPSAEFWQKFEAELHQKQLAALVERRSWWQALPRLLQTRSVLPIGATAVLAFTFVSVRNQNVLAPVTPSELTQPVSGVVADHTPARFAPVVATVRDGRTADGESLAEPAIDDRTAVAATPLSQSLPEQAVALGPWGTPRSTKRANPAISTFTTDLPPTEALPAGEGLTPVGLASLWQGAPADRPVGREITAHALEIAAVSAVASRRSRLLAQFSDRQFTQDPTAPEVFRERIARRLADTEQTGGWTRVGVRADRVSLKF